MFTQNLSATVFNGASACVLEYTLRQLELKWLFWNLLFWPISSSRAWCVPISSVPYFTLQWPNHCFLFDHHTTEVHNLVSTGPRFQGLILEGSANSLARGGRKLRKYSGSHFHRIQRQAGWKVSSHPYPSSVSTSVILAPPTAACPSLPLFLLHFSLHQPPRLAPLPQNCLIRPSPLHESSPSFPHNYLSLPSCVGHYGKIHKCAIHLSSILPSLFSPCPPPHFHFIKWL